MDKALQAYVFSKRVDYVFQAPIGSFLSNMTCGILVIVLLSPVVDIVVLLAWLTVLALVSFARLLIAIGHAKQSIAKTSTWFLLYSVGTLVSAVVWGVLPVLYFPDDIIYQFYMVFMIIGIIQGAGYSQAPFLKLHSFYSLILCVPVIFRLLFDTIIDGLTVGAGLILVFAGLSGSARRMNRLLLESLELRFELQEKTFIDSLTGIANRRRFDQFLEQAWQISKRQGCSIALLMIDVDFFKPFNDCYGHQEGDHCLTKIAKTIARVINRPSDIVTRYGGEEFAAILPNTNDEGAQIVADNICQAIYEQNIFHSENPNGRVTVSIGVATTYPSESDQSESLISSADKALYGAKKEGRNRIYTAKH